MRAVNAQRAAVLSPDELEDVRLRAARNNAAFWEHGPRRMGQRWERWDDLSAADPGSPSMYLNSATVLRPVRDEAHGTDIAARLNNFYEAADGGGFMLWSAWPLSDLTRFGFRGPGRPPLMMREAGLPFRPAPPGLEVVEVTDTVALTGFERVLVDGYPAPELQPFQPGSLFDLRVLGGPARYWIGRQAGAAVACAAACVSDGVVGIYAVAALPEVRGRGYGTAVTAAATLADPSLPGVLVASDLGAPVYASMGYRQVGHFEIWVHPSRRG